MSEIISATPRRTPPCSTSSTPAAIRSLGGAKAESYRVGVEVLGAQSYTMMQLMQIIGERNVRIVPDVAVNGAGANPRLVDDLLGVMLKHPTAKAA